jgi:hypothetical protein
MAKLLKQNRQLESDLPFSHFERTLRAQVNFGVSKTRKMYVSGKKNLEKI